MTPEERARLEAELELLELEAEDARLRALQGGNPKQIEAAFGPKSTADVAAIQGRALGHGVRSGASFDFADELGGAVQAHQQALARVGEKVAPEALLRFVRERGLGAPIVRDEQGQPLSLAEVYRQAREGNRAEARAVEATAPGYYLGGQFVGAALTPGAAASRTARAALGSGFLMGGAAGLGSSEADLTRGEIGTALGDSGKGALAGAATGLGFNLGGRLLKSIASGVVTPTPAAQRLRARGTDLTLGQSNPQSWLGQIEEAGQSVDGLGAILQGQRQRGRESWQDVVLGEAYAPGATPVKDGTTADKLTAAYKSFTPAYDAVRSEQVRPLASLLGHENQPLVVLDDAFNRAVDDPRIYATQDQVASVRGFLKNQNSLIERERSGAVAMRGTGTNGAAPPAGTLSPTVPAGAILETRSNIRTAIQEALAREDYTTARLLENAEKALSGGLEAQLPEGTAAALRATDRQYAKHKVVSDAVRRSGDSPDGFTPAQLSAAIRGATEPGAYARGGGGSLRDLAADAREVFDVRSPPTGARLATLGPLKYLSSGIAAAANRPSLKKAALGEYRAQRAALTLGELARLIGLTRALRGGSVQSAADGGDE